MVRQCLSLLVISAAVWVAAAGPAYWLAGETGLLGLSLAAVLCLVPGWLVFIVAGLYGDGDSRRAVVALGGTLFRLLFVAGGVLAVVTLRPELHLREFVIWVLVYYVVLLAAETLVVIRQANAGR